MLTMRKTLLAIACVFALAVNLRAQTRPLPNATAASSPAPPSGAQAGSVDVDHCEVKLDEESQVPAQEAGVLKGINVREGQQVVQDTLLAQIDDYQAQKQKQNAQAEYLAAKEKATGD